MVGVDCLLGRKVLRFCYVKGRKVLCDGLCHVTFSVVDRSDAMAVHICALWEDAFDLGDGKIRLIRR